MNQSTAVRADIDFEALASNVSLIRRIAGCDKQLIASIKANAYGHGVVPIAQALQALKVDALATGSLEEAQLLRQHGISLPILLFAFADTDLTIQAVIEGFIPTLTDFQMAKAISGAVKSATPVYLKIDAGLGRLGEPLDSARKWVEQIFQLPNLEIEGIYTHLPFSDAKQRDWAAQRLQAFDRFVEELKNAGYQFSVTQAMASCCLLARLQDRCNAVCVGHALYGLSPFLWPGSVDVGQLRPVMKNLKSRIIHTSRHAEGSDIAVGGLYGLKRPRTIGVLPTGMAHGLCKPVEGRDMTVLIKGKRAKVLSVSLEHTTVDLDGIEGVTPGDPVTLLGLDGDEEISLSSIADAWGIQPLEALMRMSGRFSVRPMNTSDL
jgi:alanine racemase